ncbi:MAG: MBL fold metallo-hydrolase [Candidatus Thermoplasmatota archaeon]|nr:MBL fold metallo-hydrolase [Candidatus Thermoplasmatota archaeon]
MIKIRWHGHACFEISNDLIIVTDPHDGSSIGIRPPNVKADVVLVSHDHYDHNKVKAVGKEGTKVIRGGNENIDGIEISSLKAYHDKEEGKRRGEITIFKFTIEGTTFCHLGDLGHAIDDDSAEKIGNVDILFVPIGGVFTIDGKEALEVCKKIKPKVIVPMHYKVGGLSIPIERIDAFLDNARKYYEIRHVANEIEIESDDLPVEEEIWVFTL